MKQSNLIAKYQIVKSNKADGFASFFATPRNDDTNYDVQVCDATAVAIGITARFNKIAYTFLYAQHFVELIRP